MRKQTHETRWQINDTLEDLKNLARRLQASYDDMDDVAKTRLMRMVAGGAAILGIAIAAKSIKNHRSIRMEA